MDKSGGRRPWVDRVLFATLVIAATALSMAATGFRFGVNNNVFHIPYVLDYASLPQFRDDPVYRSLDKFVSLAWPAVRLVTTETNVRAVFLAGLILGRLAAFAALLAFFRSNGLVGRWAPAAALAIVAGTPWLAQLSVIGGHGLFIGYFTHSELSWGPLLGALVAVQQRRLGLAGLLCGITFCLNFFVGLWLLAAIALPVLTSVRGWPLPGFLSRLAPIAPIRPAAVGRALVIFLVVASPVIGWVVSTLLETRTALPFDYAAYLRLYFPDHSLIDAAPATELVEFALILTAYALAALLSPAPRFWMLVLAGWSLLFVIGATGPYLVDSKLLFNLNAIRSVGFVQFIGFGLVILTAVRTIIDDGPQLWERLAACLILAELVHPDRQVFQLLAVDLLLAVMLLWRRRATGLSIPLLATAYVAVVVLVLVVQFSAAATWSPNVLLRLVLLIALGGSVLRGWRVLSVTVAIGIALFNVATFVKWRKDGLVQRLAVEAPFEHMTDWVRRSALAGPFLVPVDKPHRDLFDNFQLKALRPVWVDWKQGAVVMWEPAFYPRWSQRYAAVERLKRPDEFLAYAAANDIPYIVLPEDIGGCGAARTLYRDGGYAICASGGGSMPAFALR